MIQELMVGSIIDQACVHFHLIQLNGIWPAAAFAGVSRACAILATLATAYVTKAREADAVLSSPVCLSIEGPQ